MPAPEIARHPTSIVPAVQGIFFRSPPISVISLVWQAWITEPEQRNSRALKQAWVNKWNRPAAHPPTPKENIM